MFYIIEYTYCGPNPYDEKWIDWDSYDISTTPARTNSSNEVRTDGWCGTTNDISVRAHGEFDTLEDAKAAISQIMTDYREVEVDADDLENTNSDGEVVVVARYKVGAFQPMTAEQSGNWCYEYRNDITADTTDEQIEAMIEEAEESTNSECNSTLDDDAVREMLTERRDELLKERSKKEEDEEDEV